MAAPFSGRRTLSSGRAFPALQLGVGRPFGIEYVIPSSAAGPYQLINPDTAAVPAGKSPSWSVDWTAGTSIPAELSVSRTTATTYFDASGLLASAASNVACVEYYPDTLALAGLSVQGPATNLATKSNSFLNDGSPWNYVNAAMSQNATGPDGVANSAWTLTTAANARTLFYAGIGTADYAILSIFVKAGASGFVVLGIGDATGANTFQSWFNPSTGAWTNTNVQVAGSTHNVTLDNHLTQLLPNGFYRISFKASNPGSSFNAFSYGLSTNDTVDTATTSDSVIIFGAQFEQATAGQTEPTSYIPTTGAAAFRGGDVISSTDAGLLAAKGWVIEIADGQSGIASTILGVNTITALGEDANNFLTTADGGAQTTKNKEDWTTIARAGIAWDSTPRVSISLDGWVAATAANTASTPTALYFGSLNNGASNFIFGHIRMMAAYASVDDTQLQALTPVGASLSISGPSSAVVAQTLGALVQAATGTVLDQAVIAQTLGALSQAATATVLDQSTVAQTLGSLSQAAAAAVLDQLTASQTLGAISQTAAATVVVKAAVAQSLGVLGQAAAGTVIDTATVAQALGVLGQAAAATIADNAAAAQTLGPLGQSAAATHPDTAAVAQALGALVQAATSGVLAQANALQTLGALAQAATAAAVDSAVVAQTLGALGQAATGTVSEAITVAQALGALSQAAAATHPDTAAAAQTLGALVQTATAGAVDSAVAAQTLGALAQAATAAAAISAAATQTLDPLGQAAAATHPDTAAASQTLGPLGQVATAATLTGFVAAQTLGAIVQALTGTVIDAATVAQALGGLTQATSGGPVDVVSVDQSLGELGQAATAGALVRASVSQVLGALAQTATAALGATPQRNLAADQVLGALQQVAAARVAESALATQLLGALGQSARAALVLAAQVHIHGGISSSRIRGSMRAGTTIRGQIDKSTISGQVV